MVTIYYTIAAIAYGIFVIQFILSWFGSDIDLDADLDVGDVVTFKGLIHFAMGFSGWLCLKAEEIHIYDYFIAFAIGIIFVYCLYYLYKFCIKLQHQIIPEEGEALVGRTGIIYLITNSYYIITIEINGASSEIYAYPEMGDSHYSVGDQIVISSYKQNKYYFK